MATAKPEQVENNRKKKGKYNKFSSKRKEKKSKEEISIETINTQCAELLKVNSISFNTFKTIPLSEETQKGLEYCKYTTPTEIQRDSLRYSLNGYDVVGAAKTGSGKTLALVIPLLECLWKARWLRSYGLGALILSPTRELALQTFTYINNVGKYHNFSCALLIGGTDVSYERNRLGTINIVVCTPGRLLQHMDENENFNYDQLQIMVVDEADRMLDMGFSKQINSIIGNLPDNRQTLLFSATQTKNVKDLTRVCTKDPVFISVHENSTSATPDELQQSYLMCEEPEKINTLWSFIKMHKRKKMLIFVSSCKQARFITDAFCHLRPGTSVMGLWGTMNQTKRIACFQKFENIQSGVLIATDIASRGLDFSDVDWVVQMDAPATVDDYIHRVGRTARMKRKGRALIFLTPAQEKPMVQLLKTNNIDVAKLNVDPNAITDIHNKLQSVLAQFPELNQFAQKSLVGYLRSVYVMKDKSIFDVKNIDAAAVANSYGLMSAPRVRFLSKKGIVLTDGKGVSAHKESGGKEINANPSNSGFVADLDDNEELFTVKKTDVFNIKGLEADNDIDIPTTKLAKQGSISRVKAAKKLLHKGVSTNTKKIFDDDNEETITETIPNALSIDYEKGLNIEEAKMQMKTADEEDKQRFKEIKKRFKAVEKRKRSNRNDDEIDLQDDNGSGINSDADLDWLPDPDKNEVNYAENDSEGGMSEISNTNPNKKRRIMNLSQTEEEALNLLNPF